MTSRREVGNGSSTRRKILVPRVINSSSSKQRDEDLLLFREMHQRENDRQASLLHPISDEFEANGKNAFYRLASGKRSGPGLEFVAESGKNDYDWLKTPPATPLFPSLEMEANAPDMIIHREIPIFQPLSRFAGNSETATTSTQKSTSPVSKLDIPVRLLTPSRKPSTLLLEKKNMKSSPQMNLKMNLSSTTGIEKPNPKKESHQNFMASNFSKCIGVDSITKPKSRGVSPLVRSKISAQIPGVSNEAPPPTNLSKNTGVASSRGVSPIVRSKIPGFFSDPNLKTDRSLSASRGRSGNQNQPVGQKQESEIKSRRQSCSPSVTRGRKLEIELGKNKGVEKNINKAQIVGSRMVNKFMNSRISNAEDKKIKNKLNCSMNESSGFGRVISKSSLDMALKHMEEGGHGRTNARNSSTNATPPKYVIDRIW